MFPDHFAVRLIPIYMSDNGVTKLPTILMEFCAKVGTGIPSATTANATKNAMSGGEQRALPLDSFVLFPSGRSIATT